MMMVVVDGNDGTKFQYFFVRFVLFHSRILKWLLGVHGWLWVCVRVSCGKKFVFADHFLIQCALILFFIRHQFFLLLLLLFGQINGKSVAPIYRTLNPFSVFENRFFNWLLFFVSCDLILGILEIKSTPTNQLNQTEPRSNHLLAGEKNVFEFGPIMHNRYREYFFGQWQNWNKTFVHAIYALNEWA